MALPDLTQQVTERIARDEAGASAESSPPATPAAPDSAPAPSGPAPSRGESTKPVARETAAPPASSAAATPAAGASAPAAPAPTGEEAQRAEDIGLVTKLIESKGAKAVIDALPEQDRIKLGSVLYPKLHRTLSGRPDLTSPDAVETIVRLLERQGRSFEEFRDEVNTAGMSETEKQAYLRDKERRRAAETAREEQAVEETPEETAIRQERYNTVWREIAAAGLPVDREDADVRSIWGDILSEESPLYHERDFGRILGYVRSRANDLASKRKKPADTPAGSTASGDAPEGFIRRSEAERLASEAVRQQLSEMGLLTADTGRPGNGSAGTESKQPKTMDEARQRSIRRLEEAERV